MDIKEPELASLLNIADRLKKVETALADILPLDQFIERIEKIETYISTSKEVLNLEEVCLLLNTSKSQIYRLTRLMAIPHYKPTGKSLYFNRKEVLEWIQSHPIGVNLENVKALENGTAPVKCIESRNENKIRPILIAPCYISLHQWVMRRLMKKFLGLPLYI